jgi:hypothetical protein
MRERELDALLQVQLLHRASPQLFAFLVNNLNVSALQKVSSLRFLNFGALVLHCTVCCAVMADRHAVPEKQRQKLTERTVASLPGYRHAPQAPSTRVTQK